jgi:hypothetical protein
MSIDIAIAVIYNINEVKTHCFCVNKKQGEQQ